MDLQVKKLGENKIVLAGTITFATVPRAQKLGYRFIAEAKNPVFDLKNVVVEDGSGVALLIEWVKFAKKKHGKTIEFINLPNQLLGMIKLGGLENMLPITSRVI